MPIMTFSADAGALRGHKRPASAPTTIQSSPVDARGLRRSSTSSRRLGRLRESGRLAPPALFASDARLQDPAGIDDVTPGWSSRESCRVLHAFSGHAECPCSEGVNLRLNDMAEGSLWLDSNHLCSCFAFHPVNYSGVSYQLPKALAPPIQKGCSIMRIGGMQNK